MSFLQSVHEQVLQAIRDGQTEFAIELAQFSLTKLSRSGSPNLWAAFQSALAGALSKSSAGDRAANMEAAILAMENVVDLYRSLASTDIRPQAKLASRQFLAELYLERLEGNRADGLEMAIRLYEENARTSSAPSEAWVIAHTCLGEAYLQRKAGDALVNLERSLEYTLKALEVLSPEVDLHYWLRAKLASAEVFLNRGGGVREDNVERALGAANDVLAVISRDHAPLPWAMAMFARAASQRNRIRGGRAENQEESIAAYESALQIVTREVGPVLCAQLKFGLGCAFAERLRGDKRDNLAAAGSALTEAAELLSPDDSPGLWSDVMNSRGIVCAESARLGIGANWPQAIVSFEQVFSVSMRSGELTRAARAARNLGIVYLDVPYGTRSVNIGCAIRHFKRALEVFTRETAPFEWADTLMNLAFVYQAPGFDDEVDASSSFFSALAQASEILTLEDAPARHASIQRALGHWHFRTGNWMEASKAYASALSATADLFGASVFSDARQLELAPSQGAPARAAYALTRLGRVAEAVVMLESEAAQAVREVLARNQAALDDADDVDRRAFVEARSRVDTLEAEDRRVQLGLTAARQDLAADLKRSHAELRGIVERIRARLPTFMPEAMSFQAICGLTGLLQQPLCYLADTSRGAFALIVIPGAEVDADVDVVWLDDFTNEDASIILDDRSHEDLGYLSQVTGPQQGGEDSALAGVLAKAWPVLEQRLMGPVTSRLSALGYTQCILIARGRIASLPIHAVGNDISFTAAPAAQVLQSAYASDKHRAQREPLLLGIGNPQPASNPLPFAATELEFVASQFRGIRRILKGDDASRSNVMRAMPAATHVHFACHAQFDNRSPLSSRLELAGESRLTLMDVLNGDIDLSAIRLVVLSACKTGVVDLRNAPSEAFGFPAAFLQSGVSAVISSLWSVDDISTGVLMEAFYKRLLDDASKSGRTSRSASQALHAAQQWMRRATAAEMGLANRYERHYRESGDLVSYTLMDYYARHPEQKSFEHPYFWAAFVFSGATACSVQAPQQRYARGGRPCAAAARPARWRPRRLRCPDASPRTRHRAACPGQGRRRRRLPSRP